MTDQRSPRKDAARNRAAVFAAADALFAHCRSPEDVTMADIAAAAGVGKGTLFRAFGDRTGLIGALYEARLEPLRNAVEDGPPPLGPATPPLQRVPALLDAVLCLKLDNRHLALALEGTGADSPYRTAPLRAVAHPAQGPSGTDPGPGRHRLHRPRPARRHPGRPRRLPGRRPGRAPRGTARAAGAVHRRDPRHPHATRAGRRQGLRCPRAGPVRSGPVRNGPEQTVKGGAGSVRTRRSCPPWCSGCPSGARAGRRCTGRDRPPRSSSHAASSAACCWSPRLRTSGCPPGSAGAGPGHRRGGWRW